MNDVNTAIAKSDDKDVLASVEIPDVTGMFVKAQLATRISDAIKAKRVTQAKAAEMIGMPKSKLSGLLRGQLRGVSETKMMECLVALGQDVEIVVRSAVRGQKGQVHVRSTRLAVNKKHPAVTSSLVSDLA